MTHQISAEACKVFLRNDSLVFGMATCASSDNMQDKHDSFSSLVKRASCKLEKLGAGGGLGWLCYRAGLMATTNNELLSDRKPDLLPLRTSLVLALPGP